MRQTTGIPGALDRCDVDAAVRAAAQGQGWGWDVLIDRFGGLVRGVARRHGLASYDVDDVAQVTWMRLVEHIGELRNPDAIPGWLATTARRESLVVLRRSDREYPIDDVAAASQVDPVDETRLVAAEREAAVRAGVAQLKGRQRELITMMLSEPAPDYACISQRLQIPQGSIGPTRQRGLDRLRADEALVALCAN